MTQGKKQKCQKMSYTASLSLFLSSYWAALLRFLEKISKLQAYQMRRVGSFDQSVHFRRFVRSLLYSSLSLYIYMCVCKDAKGCCFFCHTVALLFRLICESTFAFTRFSAAAATIQNPAQNPLRLFTPNEQGERCSGKDNLKLEFDPFFFLAEQNRNGERRDSSKKLFA